MTNHKKEKRWNRPLQKDLKIKIFFEWERIFSIPVQANFDPRTYLVRTLYFDHSVATSLLLLVYIIEIYLLFRHLSIIISH